MRGEGPAGLTAPGAALHPTPRKGCFTTYRTSFKTQFILFQHQGVFLTLLLMTLSPKGVPVWEGEWRDGAVWAALDRDGAANPKFALFTSPLPL